MDNNILHCGKCGKPLDFNINTLETHPIVRNSSSEWYTYVVFPCFCQYDNKKILKYYLTAEAYYELIRLLKLKDINGINNEN